MSAPELSGAFLDLVAEALDLSPGPHWQEALRLYWLPSVPRRITLFDSGWWRAVEKRFPAGKPEQGDVYMAGWLLLLDIGFYLGKHHNDRDGSPFAKLARVTSGSSEPVLRVAHCLRDLAYGDESRTEELVEMVRSSKPEYCELFKACYWAPAREVEATPKKGRKVRKKTKSA